MRDHSPAGPPAAQKALTQEPCSQSGRAFGGWTIEHRQHHRLDHAVPEYIIGADQIADRDSAVPGKGEASEGQVVDQTRARRAAMSGDGPPRHAAVIYTQGPAAVIGEIVEGEICLLWPV
jgi:hypothetical protein